MRETKAKRIRRIIASVIAVMMLAATIISFDTSTMTGNAASLKHIDEIVAESGTFNILEIVPDTSAASFGYYIEGQEPVSSADFDTYFDGTQQINGWKATLAQKTSFDDRRDFVKELFGRLDAADVLGNTASSPLQYTYYDGADNYTEAYLVDDPQNWSSLRLQTPESDTMTGTFSPLENGGYRPEYIYSPAIGGGYVQNIAHFEYTASAPAEDDTYFYSPVFTQITAGTDLTDTPTMKWSTTAVYIELKDAFDVNVKDVNGQNIYVTGPFKTVKEILDNGGFDASVNYYYVDPTQTGAPGAYSPTNYYAAFADKSDSDDAPGDGYVSAAGSSYFSRSIESYTYVRTGGNYTFTDTGTNSYTVNFTDIYYKAGFKNNNLFKQYVLGLVDPAVNPNEEPDYNALNVTVTVRKASQVTSYDISAAGMIYISAGTTLTTGSATTGYATDDLTDARAIDLYNYAAMQYPLIIDYPIIQGITEATPPDQLNNVKKLCLLSLQSGMTVTSETSLSGLTVNWTDLSYLADDADKTFVNNSIYCFNAFNTASTAVLPNPALPGAHDVLTLVTALFGESYSYEVYTSGFSAVLAEIQNENFLKQIAGETNLLPENVTVSACVRHIMNFKGQRQKNPKTSIKVLDLEPAKVTPASPSYLTAATVRSWINNTLPEDKITIVHMTTGEFIGKIEDINETYDMVYIGMSTESLNTSGGSTVYNDPNMNGLIYSNIGDVYRASLELAGIRNQDYVYVNGTKAIAGGSGTTANQFRFSGNDITETKVADLKKFAQAGYPVILADGFITDTGTINTAKIDSSSYMYTAVSGIYPKYQNVMKQSYAGNIANADTVIKYLNVSKPALSMTTKPVEYESDNNASISVNPNDGYYYLNYVFSINNVTDPTPVTTTYDCRAYIDLNADGRYSDNERLDDIEVSLVSDGTLVAPLMSDDGTEYYALSADIEYQVTRQMPDSYAGIIPWKLEVVKNGADQIHASSQGYTRIAPAARKTINVLQIMQPGTLDTKLNLEKQTTVTDANGIYTGIYGRLINDLKDFSVTIRVITADVLETKGTTSDEILNWINTSSVNNKGADMLIIGFNDCFNGIQTKSGNAIVSYINSGKSVLFTHDTTSLSQVPASNFPMAVDAAPLTLTSSNILYNSSASTYQNVKSSNSEVFWYDSVNTALPPAITSAAYQYVVFITATPAGNTETDYFAAKAGNSGSYAIYKVTGNSYVQLTSVTSATSLATFKSNNGITTPILYVRCNSASGKYTNPSGNLLTTNQRITAAYNITKFVGGAKYNLNNYAYSYSVGYNGATSVSTTTYTAHLMCLFKSTVTNYTYSGTYNSGSNTYVINAKTWYPATGAPFPQSTLYADDPAGSVSYTLSTIPNNIADWGYVFNTVIRDAVGLDRYGVTSSIPVDENRTLGQVVNVSAAEFTDDIGTVLDYSRSVAFAPKSAKAMTVNEYQGYTNYALIRFAANGNTYKYTNNTYTNRETTNVSQVNKGQITTYPYNVNTASFGGSTGSGGSYMKIGLTHEQYFQINMNTDDIVVWYCMSNGGTDDISYYDDVPNDSVNAYYIYNKGNVTYSGVGHSSNASLYTGTSIAPEYVNEAKLFVNTMIAAYQSAAQAPKVSIKRDARGTSDISDKYMLTDNASVLSMDLGPTDESRAVYYRISDPNVGVSKTITVQYFVSDNAGGTIDPTIDANQKVSPLGAVETYQTNGTAVSTLKGGYVYKFFLMDKVGTVEVLDQLKNENVYAIKIYVKVTTMIGSTLLAPAVDSIEVKKLQLFDLS